MQNKTPTILPASNFTDAVVDRFHPRSKVRPGFPLQWPHTKNVDLRIMPGELSIWTGINGHGKSLLLNQVMLMAINSGESGVIASFEMRNDKTLYRMVRQATGIKDPPPYQIENALAEMSTQVNIYDFVGRADTKTMMRLFRSSATGGCSQFIIDSLMKCGLDEDDYNSQKRLTEELQNFAQDANCHVHLVAHPRKLTNEHDMPGKLDVLGGSSITNLADNGFTVWRNKKKEDALSKCFLDGSMPDPNIVRDPDAVLWCWKHREDGSDVENKYPLWYDKESMQYLGEQNGRPVEYLTAAPF